MRTNCFGSVKASGASPLNTEPDAILMPGKTASPRLRIVAIDLSGSTSPSGPVSYAAVTSVNVTLLDVGPRSKNSARFNGAKSSDVTSQGRDNGWPSIATTRKVCGAPAWSTTLRLSIVSEHRLATRQNSSDPAPMVITAGGYVGNGTGT